MNYVPYLDCSATSPIEDEVLNDTLRYLCDEFGNSGSRTHEFGIRANRAVEAARREIAEVVNCDPAEVVITSGATESNNLAILGLAAHGRALDRNHIVVSAIEHKAVLEPVEHLTLQGFEVSLVSPGPTGRVSADDVIAAIRPDTLLVSIMHANNETGVIQPIEEIFNRINDTEVFRHTDAAQTFGKEIASLRSAKADLVSISGHKIYGPKGVGALICRRRNGARPPLQPLMYGGSQERGLRPGTMPVALAVGLGTAARLALRDHENRARKCREFRQSLLKGLAPLNPTIHGDQDNSLPHVVNLSFSDLDSEAVMLALKNDVAISNGSACTSASYTPSHVMKAMGLSDSEAETATRWSWSHLTPEPDWAAICDRVKVIM